MKKTVVGAYELTLWYCDACKAPGAAYCDKFKLSFDLNGVKLFVKPFGLDGVYSK